MQQPLSNAQIDRLGDRLRRRDYGDAELRLLDEYRRTFGPAYEQVVATVERVTGLAVSGRPAKSTSSIIEKLSRESIRLSQMQDIAGCRIVVGDIVEQNRVAAAISDGVETTVVLDRREKPSHGYRAMHLVIRQRGKTVEVQIRTRLQHVWAEMCEKCADLLDPAIKYGGGPPEAREVLDDAAKRVQTIENLEAQLAALGEGDSGLARKLRDVRTAYESDLEAIVRNLLDSDDEQSS